MRFRCQHFGLMKYHLFVQFVPAQDLAELIDSGFLKVVVVADFDFAEVFALWVVGLDYPNLKNHHWNRCLVRHCQASLNQDHQDSPLAQQEQELIGLMHLIQLFVQRQH